MTSLRLLPPAPGVSAPEPDAAGRAVLDAVADPGAGHLLVVGGPGSGKTSLAVEVAAGAVTERGTAPERVLVIAPTRLAAATLRDRVTLAMSRPTGTPVVRTAASTGFAILTAQARSNDDPAPVLLTGAEQDVELRTLLEGHRRGAGAAVDWDGVVPPEATALPGFREELRNLLMRAAEAGLTPEDVENLGRRTERPAWIAAARTYAEYLDVTQLRSSPEDQGERFDPARVVADAAHALENWEQVAAGPRPAWDLVVVDDYQDATAATTHLLHALAAGGSRLVLIGNADEAVQGYRGAVPSGLADATRPVGRGGFGATRFELDGRYRQHPALAQVTDAVVQRIGVSGEGSARRSSVGPVPDGDAPVTVVTAPHAFSQSRAIATMLRHARHGLEGTAVPWGRMAVIARSTAQLRALRSDLLAADIPCETLGDALALHAEPAVAPLLTMLRAALGEPWTEEAAIEVLGSRVIGLDPVGVRRLRKALVREERGAGGQRASGELLVEAMGAPGRFASLRDPEATRAAKAVGAVSAGATAANAEGATAGTVLWAMWEALGVAQDWRAAALAGSARDDADLDAVIALLRAAQIFTERLPHAKPAQFVNYLEGQDFAADSLGARAQATDVVTFATPASAAGREWDVVVVAGVEEGVWPNLRLRDSVLGAQHLVEILAARAEPVPLTDAGRVEAAHAARRAVLDDETRALAVAVSRARRQLIVTCVEGEESRPSRYLAWIESAAAVERTPADQLRGVSDLRAAVTRLRVTGAQASGEERERHAQMLAHLAYERVAGANPREWHGVAEPSTTEGLWSEDVPVRVSPSKVDTVELCALKWALETVGGTRESTEKQHVGSLIHEIAAAHPHGTESELAAALEERWHEVGGSVTWADRVQREKADAMVRRLAAYIRESQAQVVRVEEGFRVQIGRAVLAGSADRVEIVDGVARIVDLKTGAAMTKAEAEENGQLAMYQLAAEERAFDGVVGTGGAELVYVGGTSTGPARRAQEPIDADQQRLRLAAVVDVMAGTSFVATPNDKCPSCPVRRSCPARPTGRQVSDG